MPPFSPDLIYRAIRDSSVEFVILLGLWMLYVSSTQSNQVVAGVAAALIAAVADSVLKAEGFAKFQPRLRWLLLITSVFGHVIPGSWQVMRALARRLLGRKSQARFKAVSFRVGGEDDRSWARRTLVTIYGTIPPDSIVIGVDRKRRLLLVHEIAPAGIPHFATELGAE